MTDLRHSPPYEFGKKETCPHNVVTLETLLYLYIICFKSLQRILPG